MIPTKRIEYIDALRGFTMILVVFAHVETIGFSDAMHKSFFGDLFCMFRMPLFFFISGFIAWREREWRTPLFIELSLKKIRVQLIPTLIFGLFLTYIISDTDIVAFITSPTKMGLWFTIALLEMFLISYLLEYILYILQLTRFRILAFAVLVLCASGLKVILVLSGALPQLVSILSLHYVLSYLPFFVLGYICSIKRGLFFKFIEEQRARFLIIIIFILTAIYSIKIGAPNNIVQTIVEYVGGVTGLLIVFTYFRRHQDVFSVSTIIGRNLQYVGRRTFDIYLIHNMLIPHFPQLGYFFTKHPMPIIELFVNLFVSLLIVFGCLVISSVIRLSNPLATLCFGVKQKNNNK